MSFPAVCPIHFSLFLPGLFILIASRGKVRLSLTSQCGVELYELGDSESSHLANLDEDIKRTEEAPYRSAMLELLLSSGRMIDTR